MSDGQRNPWLRFLIALLLWLASLFAAAIVADVLPLPELGADIVASVLLMGIYSQMAPLVSYRWFDALLLIPLVQLWWSATVMWRISSLAGQVLAGTTRRSSR